VLTASNPILRGYAEGEEDAHRLLSLRFLLAVDVEGFSRRSTSEQMKVQHDLEHAMATAAAKADLDRRSWYRQPGGDGELAVLPQDGNGLSLVADYPGSLAGVLGEINRSAPPGSRLRVRMAIHHGAVTPAGPFGPVGDALIVVSRLIDAPALRQRLVERHDADVALMVSSTVFDEIVRSQFRNLDPKMFSRSAATVKGRRFVGYLAQSLPGTRTPNAPVAPPNAMPMLSRRSRTACRQRRPAVLRAENGLAKPVAARQVLPGPRPQLAFSRVESRKCPVTFGEPF
jgi:hypothetical protein